MKYDVIIIGAGLSGLSAASLLAKSGLKVAVIEQANAPGGACGIFKRDGAVFDQGAAMLYGFGEHGFNAHRFLFNCLEEPIAMVKHDLLYVVHYNGKKIRFFADIDRFIKELSDAFPGQEKNIRRFYKDMQKCYTHVISETPNYSTPDTMNPKDGLKSVLRHPVSYMRFLSYLNISAKKLLSKYFSDPDILHFFDKLTSTYCYATLDEAPAILASVMFIDNHEGGSYYPAGSTLFLPGKLEKVIEENNGDMYYGCEVCEVLFEEVNDTDSMPSSNSGIPCGVLLKDGHKLYADNIIYSGSVWNLYGKLLSKIALTEKEMKWAAQIPTYPSVVLYSLVDKKVIPGNTAPIEMLAANPEAIDESEITVYILSIDDHTICDEDKHVVIAIGPSFRDWKEYGRNESKNYNSPNTDYKCKEGLSFESPKFYYEQKKAETLRILSVLEKRFPGFNNGLTYCELATPVTIERYTMKNGGAAAGPKQMLGQHMLLRQPVCTRFENLYVCGESTTMGTGTPTVTTSGIAAANAILEKTGLPAYIWEPSRKNYVHILKPPVEKDWMQAYYGKSAIRLMTTANKCLFCEHPSCCQKEKLDIPDIMRRVACGNFIGAKKELERFEEELSSDFVAECEKKCIQTVNSNNGVLIWQVLEMLQHA